MPDRILDGMLEQSSKVQKFVTVKKAFAEFSVYADL
jgi:hypothetical protein